MNAPTRGFSRGPGPVLSALVVLGLLSGCMAQRAAELPAQNRPTLPAPEIDARDLGREAAARLLGRTPLLDDPPAQAYLNRLGVWLALQGSRPELDWRFGITDTDEVQAFGLPGGLVLVSRGLLVLLETEDEVAAVLAHEISHVSAADHVRSARDAHAAAPASLLGDPVDPREGQVRALLDTYVHGLPDAWEGRADRAAVVLATRAGYDPYGLVSVLAMFDRINPADNRVSLYFDAHPPARERQAALENGLAGSRGEASSSLRETRRWPRVRAGLLHAGAG